MIYLDNCCYNRPFGDQGQERIHLESESILAVLQRGQSGEYDIIGSDILLLEMEQMTDLRKKQRVKELYKVANVFITYSENIKTRAQEIMSQSNIKPFDSLHIASAESANADVLLTTDDRLEKMATHLNLKVMVVNPLKYVEEVF